MVKNPNENLAKGNKICSKFVGNETHILNCEITCQLFSTKMKLHLAPNYHADLTNCMSAIFSCLHSNRAVRCTWVQCRVYCAHTSASTPVTTCTTIMRIMHHIQLQMITHTLLVAPNMLYLITQSHGELGMILHQNKEQMHSRVHCVHWLE